MRIMLVAGGTGGHFFPALSLVPFLKKKRNDLHLLFVLGKKRIENRFVTQIPPDVQVFRLYGSYWNWKSPARWGAIVLNAVQSLFLMIRYRPRTVILFGGYLSFFPGLWGKLLGARIIVHEQNVVPGKVNALLARWADEIWASFKESEKYFSSRRAVFKHAGLPIRSFSSEEKKDTLFCPPQKKSVLFMGGSQGAVFINRIFNDLIGDKKWTSSYYSVLVGGLKQQDDTGEHYKVLSFCENILHLYRQVDIVVARAGASTIAELLQLRVKAILIPYPYAYRNHQWYNARVAQALSGGNIITLPQKDYSHGAFTKIVVNLLDTCNPWKETITFQENVWKEGV